LEQGDSVNLSTVTLSAHTGAHADAPLHFLGEGETIGAMPLETYIGPAALLHIGRTGPILPQDLEAAGFHETPRLLLRTPASDLANDRWPEEIAFITPETAQWLAGRGVVLFGTDAPSVDALDSKDLATHHALRRAGLVWLESLYLRDVPAGEYELIALPLNLPVDGSPVRAVLRSRD
jgi:arylformamidase